jgi:phosphoglycolate phosphatase-like HAD superfamily hydrolase
MAPTSTLPGMPTRSDPTLILWDVDRTLVTIGTGLSRETWSLAFSRVTGHTPTVFPDMSGRTDRAIVAEVLRLNGIARTDPLVAALYAALGDTAAEYADRMREAGTVLPGARETVAALAARGTVQTLVTGNLRPIARTKLAACDLTAHLDLAVGGYGDDSADRADLVRLARERAASAYGASFTGPRTVVIGDTPHDIRGAHDAGALAIAVTTGRFTAADLAAADLVLPDLTHHAAAWPAFLATHALAPDA